MSFLRAIAFVISHLLIVLTIPLAFDVGGRESGLAFSLSLAVFYFFQSILRLATPPNSTYRNLVETLVRGTSWFTVFILLIWSLNKFSVDAPGSGWVARTFGQKRAQDTSITEWIFGRGGLLESASIGGWDKLLRWSVPVFQIGEGFCSLLVIQAVGQVSRWIVNQERGESWMVWTNLFWQTMWFINDYRLVFLDYQPESFQPPFGSFTRLQLFQKSAM